MATDHDDGSGGDATADIAARAASIVRDGLDIWVTQARRWYDLSRERRTWRPEDVVGDANNLIEHLTPLAERTLDLTIDLLRPWARTFEARRSDG